MGGVAVGIWRPKRQRGSLDVELEPFARLAPDVTAAIDAEVVDVRRFEGAR